MLVRIALTGCRSASVLQLSTAERVRLCDITFAGIRELARACNGMTDLKLGGCPSISLDGIREVNRYRRKLSVLHM